MELLIRKVVSGDYKDICKLLNNDLKLGLDIETGVLSKQIGRMNANENYFIRVALCDNQIVGFVAAYKALILEMPNEYMRIIGLAVKMQYRRKTVGRQLIDAVKQYAIQNGVAYIALNTLPKVEEDHAFYRALGFEKKSVCFSKAF